MWVVSIPRKTPSDDLRFRCPPPASSSVDSGEGELKATIQAAIERYGIGDRGYGFAYFCLAWKALQNQQPDDRQAREFQQVALAKHPARYWTKENLRLTIAISLMRWFGKHNYLKFLGAMQSLRSKLNSASAIGN